MNVKRVTPRRSAQVDQTRVSSMNVSPTSNETQRSSAMSESLDQAELPAHLLERVEARLEIVARVLAGHDRAHAGLVQRDRRENHGRGEDALHEQPGGESLRPGCLARDDRRDRRLADARVEPKLREPGLEEAGVIPQSLESLRLVLEHVERRDA